MPMIVMAYTGAKSSAPQMLKNGHDANQSQDSPRFFTHSCVHVYRATSSSRRGCRRTRCSLSSAVRPRAHVRARACAHASARVYEHVLRAPMDRCTAAHLTSVTQACRLSRKRAPQEPGTPLSLGGPGGLRLERSDGRPAALLPALLPTHSPSPRKTASA